MPPSQRENLVREIERVSESYFIQTPAVVFPIEPHFMMPVVHWLPRRVSRYLVRFGLYRILRSPSLEKLNLYFDEVQLLTLKELRSYAPDALIITERLLGIPKSYTLYKISKKHRLKQ